MIVSLSELSIELISRFDIEIENIKGHYELDSRKPHCPGIDMTVFREQLRNSVDDNLMVI